MKIGVVGRMRTIDFSRLVFCLMERSAAKMVSDRPPPEIDRE